MSISGSQQTYAPSLGIGTTLGFVFHTRDPNANDTGPGFSLYQGWVNTLTKAIWYLEGFTASNGAINAQWRAIGPVVVKTVAPTSGDYLYPIGQAWVDEDSNNYYVLVNVTNSLATWINLTSGSGTVDTLTGNSGGAVSPDGAGNIDVVGDGVSILIAGNPGSNTLTASATGSNTTMPAFLARLNATVTNVTGDSTAYTLICNTEDYDQTSSYDTTTGIFTAPKTGKYSFSVGCTVGNVTGSDFLSYNLYMVTSTRNMSLVASRLSGLQDDSTLQFGANGTIQLDLTSGDTAQVVVQVGGDTKTISVIGDPSVGWTFFSGSLLA